MVRRRGFGCWSWAMKTQICLHVYWLVALFIAFAGVRLKNHHASIFLYEHVQTWVPPRSGYVLRVHGHVRHDAVMSQRCIFALFVCA